MKIKLYNFLNVTFFLFLLGLIAVASGYAQKSQTTDTVAIPDTPAGRRFSQWLDVRNSGDFERMRRFVSDHYDKPLLELAPADERAFNLKTQFHADGKFIVREIKSSKNDEISVLLQTSLTELWATINVKVAPEAPFLNVRTTLLFPTDPPANLQRKMTDAQMVQWLNSYIEKMAAADAFSGSVLVAKNGKPFFQKAVGLASRAYRVPNRIDTKFNLGSMNKMFTAVAISQLVESGKLSFDDTVGKVLPDYPNKEVASKVKIHHLLMHTSGVSDYFTDKFFESSRERFKQINDFLPLFVNSPLQFEPGTRWNYSNGGFMLLGAIVEKAAGQNYFDYIRENIYKRAGMTDTDAYELDYDTPNLAVGYTMLDLNARFSKGDRSNNLYQHVVKGGPAGGGFSNAPDLLKFAKALTGNKLLSPKYTEVMLTRKLDLPNVNYGYGMFHWNLNGKRVVGHSGGFNGINSQLDMHLDTGYTIVVMSNYDPPVAERIVSKIRQVINSK